MCNLQCEMETQQLIILLQHMHAHTTLGKALEILLRTYQLWAGTQLPVLEDTRPCPWIPDQWLTWLHRTMREHNIQIIYDAWTVPPLRRYDVFIMEAVEEIGLTTCQLEQINACQMYLQITMLAKMVDHTGKLILPQTITQHPHAAPPGLAAISTSKLEWPHIHCPTTASWKLWTKTICLLFTGDAASTRLCNPLGEWHATYDKCRTW